ncbi:hypothetical protein [[Mycoplasma] gypis]|uniref:Uncharacterized protein n=1 Tax=[Mycoplasma] gypis TaxID=92404 RepID=A0ABZ2RV24_9BACT|nr:hypothetical protein [[Mycoplasma] gypis]MBN0919154.1 hypothetical protein [[Mycoplasma] gypis]
MAVKTRFYIIEKRDENENLTWQLKRAKQDNYYTFDNFSDSLKKFISIAETLEGDSRVWFHQNGAFRGSMGYQAALQSVKELEENNVESHKATDYLIEKNLIEASASSSKDEEKTQEVEQTEELVAVEENPAAQVVISEKLPKSFYLLVSFLILLIIVCIVLVAIGLSRM